MSLAVGALSLVPADMPHDQARHHQHSNRPRKPLIVSCTRGLKEETDLYRSLQRIGIDRFQFFENNTKGLSSCYNLILEAKAGSDEIVIFAHDDVSIRDTFFQEKIEDAFNKHGYAVTGVAGTVGYRIGPRLADTPWFNQPQQLLSGWVEHHTTNSSPVMHNIGPTLRRCIVLDGLFLAVDMKKAGHIRFDEQFAFHFYDHDFCLSAHEAGLVLGTYNIYLTHKLNGSERSEDFKRAQDSFRTKWLPRQPQVGFWQPAAAG
ncbi:MAG: glycosyltransferase family A protein [Xanthobacteraceae bacterium]